MRAPSQPHLAPLAQGWPGSTALRYVVFLLYGRVFFRFVFFIFKAAMKAALKYI